MLLEAGRDLGLVALTSIVAIVGIYSAMDLLRRSYALIDGQKFRVQLASSILMGVTLWTIQFLGMLSYETVDPISYLPNQVALSLIASLATVIFITFFSSLRNGYLAVFLSAFFWGIAICLMQFIGIKSQFSPGNIQFDESILIVVGGFSLLAAIAGFALFRGGFQRTEALEIDDAACLKTALLLGGSAFVAHFIVTTGVTVSEATHSTLQLPLQALFTKPELALIILSTLCLTVTLIPMLVHDTDFTNGHIGGRAGSWLLAIVLLGASMIVMGQWFMASSVQNTMRLTHISYRFHDDINQLTELWQSSEKTGEKIDAVSWNARIDGIEEGMIYLSMDELTLFHQEEHIHGDISLVAELLEGLRLSLNGSNGYSSPDSIAIQSHLDALHSLNEDLMFDNQVFEEYRQELFRWINGLNAVWFILAFSGLVAVMRRRHTELKVGNEELNQAMRELQRQKYALDKHAIVAVTDPAGYITYVNKSFCDISQYSKEELIGQNHRIVNSGHHTGAFWHDLWRTIGSGQVWQGEIKNRRKNGDYYWVYTTIVPFLDANNRIERYLALRTDITAIKEAEMVLRENEYWMNALIRSLPDEILLKDAEDRWMIANDVLLRNLGLSRNEYNGKTTEQLAEKSKILKQRLIIDGDEGHVWKHDDLVHWELEYPTTQGNAVFDVVNVPLFNDDASRKGVVRVSRDITVRKRMAEENQMLVSAVFQADEGIFIADAEGILEYSNPAYEEMTSMQGGNTAGQMVKLLKKEFIGEALAEDIWARLLQGDSWSGRIECINPNLHHECNLMATISPAYTVKGMRYVGVLRDITDETLLENRLHQAQKMEAIGRLAGGIAHDFNNILTAIIGYSDMVMDDLSVDSDTYGNMKEIQSASQRAKELVKQILTFSRRSDNERHTFEAEQVVREAVRLIRAAIPSSILIEEHYSGMPMMLEMDPTQLHQIIMNLCVNAAQAMGDNGRMEVSTALCPVEEVPFAINKALSPGFYLKLSIADNGPGIPDELHERVFEPFFTTKEVGNGTGMGLSAVHGIVINNQGDVRLHNNPGGGARFDVYLPLMELFSEIRPTSVASSHEVIQKQLGTLLYVDDEVPLTSVIQKFLNRQGFEVDIANDPLQALAMFKADPQRYDVVVSDQVMPNMRGDQLAEEILAIRPGLPFILCSGFCDTIDREIAQEKGLTEFVQKPLEFKAFAELLKKTIGDGKAE